MDEWIIKKYDSYETHLGAKGASPSATSITQRIRYPHRFDESGMNFPLQTSLVNGVPPITHNLLKKMK